MKTLEELRTEATDLGLSFTSSNNAAQLNSKIEKYKEEQAANTIKGKALKSAMQIIKEQEAENLKTKIVKISCIDKREASTATHAYFSSGDVSLNVPLDINVEMPVILIEMAKSKVHLVAVDKGGTIVNVPHKRYHVEVAE